MNKLISILILISIFPLVSSLSVDIPIPINYSLIPTVNNSQYLQSYTPTTLKNWMEGFFDSLYRLDSWDNLTGIPHATPSSGDTTHFSLASEIYDWVISLGYLTSITNIFDQSLNTTDSPNFVNLTAGYFKGDGSELTGIETGIWTNNSGTAEFEGNIDTTKDEWGIWSNDTCIVIGNTSKRSYC